MSLGRPCVRDWGYKCDPNRRFLPSQGVRVGDVNNEMIASG